MSLVTERGVPRVRAGDLAAVADQRRLAWLAQRCLFSSPCKASSLFCMAFRRAGSLVPL